MLCSPGWPETLSYSSGYPQIQDLWPIEHKITNVCYIAYLYNILKYCDVASSSNPLASEIKKPIQFQKQNVGCVCISKEIHNNLMADSQGFSFAVPIFLFMPLVSLKLIY